MKNLIQRGETLDYLNSSGEAIPSGQPVMVGALLGVATVDIAPGATEALQTEGVYWLPKMPGAAIDQGDSVDWHKADKKIGKISATNQKKDGVGIAWETAASSATEVAIKINVGGGS